MATDRATIEQLKRENATLQGLLVRTLNAYACCMSNPDPEVTAQSQSGLSQVQKGRAAAGDDGAGSGRAWLEGQIRLHKTKVATTLVFHSLAFCCCKDSG